MGETIELENFDVSFSFRCPVSANDLSSGNSECGMCETTFKVEGLDAVKIIATLD
jgi:hypothetical protein